MKISAWHNLVPAAALAVGLSLHLRAADTNAPWIQDSYPWQNEPMARNGNIAFTFSEPMATNIAIAWSNAPYTFSYSWSADRTTLFIINPASFQANVTLGYTLNQSGSGFRDLAGNMLGIYGGQVTIGSDIASPDIHEYVVAKAREFEQTNATAVLPRTGKSPYYFFAEIGQSSFVMVTNATLLRPGGATDVLGFDGDYYEMESGFADEASLNAAYPQGAYTLTANTVHDGTRALPLTLPANNFPNAPRVSNFAAAQAINPAQPFTLTWDAFSGGTTNDFIMIEIRELIDPDYDRDMWQSPDIGEPGQLNGLSNSVVIPANTFPPGRKFEIMVMFAKLSQVDTNTYPGARGIAAFTSETILYGFTTGATIKPKFQSYSFNQVGSFFQYRVTGERGLMYTVESSEDMINWWSISTQTAWTVGSAWEGSFQNTDSLGTARRFYRVREGSNPMQP